MKNNPASAPLKFWNPKTIRGFAKELKAPGTAWHWSTAPVQRALVAEKVLNVLRQQDRELVPMAAIDELTDALLAECGVSESA